MAANPRSWANGRRLTDAQRERKRAVNRESRRLQRQIEKNSCALLSPDGVSSGRNDGSEDIDALALPWPDQSPGYVQSAPTCSSSISELEFPPVETPPRSQRTPPNEMFATVPLPYLRRDPRTRDMTDLLNNGVHFALSADPSLICLDPNLNESVLAHAVLYGWASVERNHNTVCPVHAALRFIDENLFIGVGAIERLTMLHCVSRQILSCRFLDLNERQAAWPWYRARPSQNALTHEPIVDYIVWPGMRERLVFGGEQALANAFWMAFFRNFRFYWPSEDARAAFKSAGDLLVFADEFRNRLDDLSHWRFDMAFFDEFPDFADDVLPTQTLPKTLQTWVIAARREDAKRKKRRKKPLHENLVLGDEAHLHSSNSFLELQVNRELAHA